MQLRKAAISSVVLFATLAASVAAYAGLPAAHPGPTVDDYTAADSGRAEAAARKAGYGNFEITMVQDGDFFLKGEKARQTYFLTVTGDGRVYPSSPLSSVGG